MKISYNHILKNIESNPDIQEISSKLFQLGHEHEVQDNIFDIEVTPNRGDCLSLKGILRELSIFYEIDKAEHIYQNNIKNFDLNFENYAQSDCPNISFLKVVIDGDVHEYTSELENYFIDLNLNKNNFFTDVSNYISYETGQPTHCYDLNKIGSSFSLNYVNEEQTFKTLIDKEITLVGKNLVFIKDGKVINLAGVMGGESTSCSNSTRSVLIECAYFNPESIIGKSVKYDLNSDAAYKFERGVDPLAHENVLRRFVQIVKEHVNIKSVELFTNTSEKYVHTSIPLDVNKINKIIGLELSEDKYINYLTKLGFVINDNQIIVPSYRSDVVGQNDLAEEISRVIGYDNIPIKEIKFPNQEIAETDKSEEKFKAFLIDNGFYEVINNPFVKENSDVSIELDNPLDSNKKYLRTCLKNSLLSNLIYNERRQNDSIKFFEFSDIYSFDGSNVKKRVIGIIASGRISNHYEKFQKNIDIKYFKELFKQILIDNDLKFEIVSRDNLDSKLANQIVYCEIDFDEIKNCLKDYDRVTLDPTSYVTYKPISEYPKIFRDLSFSISDFNKIEELHDMIMDFENDLLKNKFVFDFFNNTKLNIVKMGFRFSFQSDERTLLDADVNAIMNEIVNETKKISGVEIPGLNS